jgi:hypothetical protein
LEPLARQKLRLARLTFEAVTATKHPEYYDGSQPIVRGHEVPDEHWSLITRIGDPDTIIDQCRYLRRLQAQGDLIRNVILWKPEIVWTKVRIPNPLPVFRLQKA